MLVYREMELVRQVLDEATLATRQRRLTVGHTRRSATGGSPWENAKPPFTTNAPGSRILVTRNGYLTTTSTTTTALAGHLIPQESSPGWPVQPRATGDVT
jgi:glutamine phosphoribosylpyrophosphate amidotransferase